MKIIHSHKAPPAIGPYSQAILTGGLLFISGQLPINAVRNELIDSIPEAVDQIMQNVAAILSEANMNHRNIVKTTVFLKRMKDFDSFNTACAKYFPESKPARSLIEVAKLPKDAVIEMEFIAAGNTN